MTYSRPQAEVHLNVQQTVSVTSTSLPAGIFGGHAYLVRYGQSSEKSLGSLGTYDKDTETCYPWNKPAGAIIDDSYVKLYMDNALLKYHEDLIDVGGSVNMIENYRNRVKSSATNYAANGTSYARTAALLRDVLPGDVVKVRGVVDGENYYLTSYIKRVLGTKVAAVIGSATDDDDNYATASAGTVITKLGGPDNCVAVASSATSYDGLKDGDVVETYTVLVTQSSVGNDYTTAKLKITSASGNDDVAEVTPSAADAATALGTRGATVTFSIGAEAGCSDDADDDSVSPTDLVAGQSWKIVVTQAYTAPGAASTGSTFTGEADTTYIVEVSRGGNAGASADADKPQITVTTSTGSDISGPTLLVEDGDDAGNTLAVAVGTKGLLITFDQIKLAKGEIWTIAATASKDGNMNILELGHSLPEEITTGTDLELKLFIKKSGLEISKNRIGYAPLTNFTVSNTELCVADGILATDSSWASGGTPVSLPVEEGDLYAEYRAWRSDMAGEINQINDIADLDSLVSGALSVDNPLKWGLAKALANSNGTSIRFAACADPSSLDSWAELLEVISSDSEIYGMVPMTDSASVHSLFSAHATAMNSPEVGLRRVLWAGAKEDTEKSVVDATTSTDLEEVLATIVDDPNTSGTQYTLLTVPGSNGNFVTNGVAPGDIVRTGYSTDGFGSVTYSTYVVDSVVSEDEILLKSGPGAAVNTAQKIEIWHTLSATERAQDIQSKASGYGGPLVRYVWGDLKYSNGTNVEGFYIAAALAGLRSGSYAHASLTRVALAGFEAEVARKQFTRSQLDILSGGGVWAVVKSDTESKIFSRHAVTTADYDDILNREESCVANMHSLAYDLHAKLDPYVGQGNVTETFFDILRTEISTWIVEKIDYQPTRELGGPLRNGSVLKDVRQHAFQKDRIIIDILALVPVPGNVLQANLNTYIDLSALNAALVA